jgi:uncharacterized protein (TIGR02452 family)
LQCAEFRALIDACSDNEPQNKGGAILDKREQRSVLANETVRIARAGTYSADGKTMDIAANVAFTNQNSIFISQQEADRLEAAFVPKFGAPAIELREESTLAAILRLAGQDGKLGVLNFASAKNPGGGFLNGAMAQEESLAAASALYSSQLQCPEYYDINRACKSMMYTDCAIWSPEVVFFRENSGALLSDPAKASVLTLPAVNYGQVLLKHEDAAKAKETMKRRMKIALAAFADKDCDAIVLGAYGCGVFRNAPADVAAWWDELLHEYGGHFGKVVFAVLDSSRSRECWGAFARKWG